MSSVLPTPEHDRESTPRNSILYSYRATGGLDNHRLPPSLGPLASASGPTFQAMHLPELGGKPKRRIIGQLSRSRGFYSQSRTTRNRGGAS